MLKNLVIVGVVLVGLFILGVILGGIQTALEEVPIEKLKSNHQVETEKTEKKPECSLEEIYDAVNVGNTEEEVRAFAGKPEMTSRMELEGLGTITDLTYTSGLNSVTVIINGGGTVEDVMIGIFNEDGGIDIRSKM